MATPRKARFIQPDDIKYCDEATGQFAREYPAKFIKGAAEHNERPFRELSNVVAFAKEEVLDQWSYLTLIEQRLNATKKFLAERICATREEQQLVDKLLTELLP